MKDRILSAQSIADLKELGSYRDVRKTLQQKLTSRLQIKSRGWKDLNEILEILRAVNSASDSTKDSLTERTVQPDIPYFKSETDRLIYALIELSGEAQLKTLGINKSHFRDSHKAKQLRNSIVHLIHPDKCNHPKAKDAMNKLTKLFNEVVG